MIVRLLLRKNSSMFQSPLVERIFHENSHGHSYLVSCKETGQAAIIDPVYDFSSDNHTLSTAPIDKLYSKVKSANLSLAYILSTYSSASHLSSLELIKSAFPGAKSAIGANVINKQEALSKDLTLKNLALSANNFDILFNNYQKFNLGEIQASVIYTQRPLPVSSVYLIGDSVFIGGIACYLDQDKCNINAVDNLDAKLYLRIHQIFKLTDSYKVYVGSNRIPSNQKTDIENENRTKNNLNEESYIENLIAFRTEENEDGIFSLESPKNAVYSGVKEQEDFGGKGSLSL